MVRESECYGTRQTYCFHQQRGTVARVSDGELKSHERTFSDLGTAAYSPVSYFDPALGRRAV